MVWNKKQVQPEQVRAMGQRYGLDALTASILARRGITAGGDLLYFIESDARFEHNPFLFSSMEDAVDRILDARDEGEKVLVFGDRDADGVTSTALLYGCLKSMGIDARWTLPSGDESYGLSREAVDSFASEFGSLIITVDCGISNAPEIEYAAEKGIDVIVTDHHNVPESLPGAAVILNPKAPDSGYPFKDISGCAVAYKLACALRFSRTELYKAEVCLLHAQKSEGTCSVTALKTKNLVPVRSLSVQFSPNPADSRSQEDSARKLLEFLKGQQIFVWNAGEQRRLLAEIFGGSVEFNVFDLEPAASSLVPQFSGRSLAELSSQSKICLYNEREPAQIDGFFNIFVTWARLMQARAFPDGRKQDELDIELVALAALADVMPLENENRIFIKRALSAMNKGSFAPGLAELFARLELAGKRLSSTDLAWGVTPVLNAPGRMGQPELAVRLLTEGEPLERDRLAERIVELNKERKQLGNEAWELAIRDAQKSIAEFGGKMCVVVDERINRGVSGILANRLMQQFGVPALVSTKIEGGIYVGSMRSAGSLNLTEFLSRMSGLFLNFGGHDAAAGFSLKEENFSEFQRRLKENLAAVELASEEGEEQAQVDAELPHDYVRPDLLRLVDFFEPYGERNPPLCFATRSVPVYDGMVLGKTERSHLKLILDCGKNKWPALYWGEGRRWKAEFNKGDRLDILYQVSRNTYNGMESAQMVLSDARRV